MFVVQVIGRHNSGKTTLIEFLTEELTKRNLKVGYIKHDPKGKGITDKPKSDTHRVKTSTIRTALVSPSLTTLWFLESLSLKQVLKFFKDLDVVIVEGFKFEKGFPKILVGQLEEDIKNPIKEEIVLTVKGKEDYKKALSWILKNLNSAVGE